MKVRDKVYRFAAKNEHDVALANTYIIERIDPVHVVLTEEDNEFMYVYVAPDSIGKVIATANGRYILIVDDGDRSFSDCERLARYSVIEDLKGTKEALELELEILDHWLDVLEAFQ